VRYSAINRGFALLLRTVLLRFQCKFAVVQRVTGNAAGDAGLPALLQYAPGRGNSSQRRRDAGMDGPHGFGMTWFGFLVVGQFWGNVVLSGAMFVKTQQQIPFGNDRQKSKVKNKAGVCGFPPFASARRMGHPAGVGEPCMVWDDLVRVPDSGSVLG
jgi:hypothetical protein